jgi:hypothetical protein
LNDLAKRPPFTPKFRKQLVDFVREDRAKRSDSHFAAWWQELDPERRSEVRTMLRKLYECEKAFVIELERCGEKFHRITMAIIMRNAQGLSTRDECERSFEAAKRRHKREVDAAVAHFSESSSSLSTSGTRR